MNCLCGAYSGSPQKIVVIIIINNNDFTCMLKLILFHQELDWIMFNTVKVGQRELTSLCQGIQ